MPNKWFERFIPNKKTINDHSRMGRLSKYINQHPDLWQLNQESVPRGAAIGLFVAIIPVMPFQTLLTILFSILFRANLPTAIAFCWANNPLTFVPIIYIPYYIGSKILGEKESNLSAFAYNNVSDLWTNFSYLIVHFGKSYFMGLPFFAIGAAIAGYIIVKLIWHISAFLKK